MSTELTTPTDSPAVQNGSPQSTASRGAPAAPRPSSPGLEAIDSILWRLEGRGSDERSLVVGVTGCGPRAGTTTVATNLAVSAGLQGCRVLLISTDPLSRPSTLSSGPKGKRHGSAELGLWDILSGDASPKECQPVEMANNVFALGAGAMPIGSARVNPQLVAEMLDEFRGQYEVVVIDLPPAEDLGGALPLARQLPGVVLVVCSEKTSQRDAQQALERLTEDGVSVLGTVLNRYQNHVPRWLRRWF